MVALLAAPVIGEACSVPVFRYALERWPADRFSGVVFVDGKLTESQDEVLASIVRLDNPVFMERLQARVGVNTRHLALPMEEYYGLTTWGKARPGDRVNVEIDMLARYVARLSETRL